MWRRGWGAMRHQERVGPFAQSNERKGLIFAQSMNKPTDAPSISFYNYNKSPLMLARLHSYVLL